MNLRHDKDRVAGAVGDGGNNDGGAVGAGAVRSKNDVDAFEERVALVAAVCAGGVHLLTNHEHRILLLHDFRPQHPRSSSSSYHHHHRSCHFSDHC